MFLINCEINLIVHWSKDCDISSVVWATRFAIIAIIISNQDNAKLLQWLKSGFKRNGYLEQIKSFNWKKNQYLNYLIGLSFQGVFWLFVLSFENNDDRKAHTGYLLPKPKYKITILWLMDKSFWSAS